MSSHVLNPIQYHAVIQHYSNSYLIPIGILGIILFTKVPIKEKLNKFFVVLIVLYKYVELLLTGLIRSLHQIIAIFNSKLSKCY